MLFSLLLACIGSEPKETITPTTAEPTNDEIQEELDDKSIKDAKEVEEEPPAVKTSPDQHTTNPRDRSEPPPAPTGGGTDAEPQLIGDSNVFHDTDNDTEGDDAPPQLTGDSNVFSGAEDDEPEQGSGSGFPGQIQTNTLLRSGILGPVPSTLALGTPLSVTFNTLYPNGCWRQSEPTHTVDGFNITHSYTTNQLENQICTMAMVPGGFRTQVNLSEAGTYTGRIVVDGTERTQYTVTVTSPE